MWIALAEKPLLTSRYPTFNSTRRQRRFQSNHYDHTPPVCLLYIFVFIRFSLNGGSGWVKVGDRGRVLDASAIWPASTQSARLGSSTFLFSLVSSSFWESCMPRISLRFFVFFPPTHSIFLFALARESFLALRSGPLSSGGMRIERRYLAIYLPQRRDTSNLHRVNRPNRRHSSC